MATYYLKSGSATEFAQSTAYSTGNCIVPLRADTGSNYVLARGWVWECTTAGTTAAANPTWPASVTKDTTTITSNTAVFTARTPGYSSGTTANWAYAGKFLDYMVNATGGNALAVGDTIYVSNNHAETTAAGGVTLTFPNSANNAVNVICGDDAAAPPTTAATTATVTWNSNGGAIINGSCYWYGITFTFGNAQNANSQLQFGTSTQNENQMYEACNFVDTATGNGVAHQFGPNGRGEVRSYKFVATKFKYGAVSTNAFSVQTARVAFVGAQLIDSAGSVPTNLIVFNGSNGAQVFFESCDLSTYATGKNLVNVAGASGQPVVAFRNCKLGASVAVSTGTATGQTTVLMDNCDSSDTNYRKAISSYLGTVVHEPTIVRTTGGASDGATIISWQMAANTLARFPHNVLSSPEIVKWNETTGSSITITVEYLHDTNVTGGQGAGTSSAFRTDEVYLEVQYLGTSGTPYALRSSSQAAPLATGADNSAGVGTASWTTTGMTTPKSGKISVSVTPQEKGFIHAVVKVAKASKTIYVDPQITVT